VDLHSSGTIKVDTDHVSMKVNVNNALSTSGKKYRGSRGIAPLIDNVGTGLEFAVKFTRRPYYVRGYSQLCLLNKRLCYATARHKELLARASFRITDRIVSYPVTTLTTCSRHLSCIH